MSKTTISLIAVAVVGIAAGIGIAFSSQEIIQESNEHKTFLSNSSLSCNCVAFRLDDVVDQKPGYLQFVVIDYFMEKEIPLTIGIIGNQFGNDQYTIDFLKNHMQNHGEDLEIANHGWNHEDFRKFSLDEQNSLIKNTNKKISDKLNTIPSVFIPPYNYFDDNTIAALKQNGISHLSSISSLDEPAISADTSDFYHLPTTSTTAEYNQNMMWTQWTGKKTIEFIEKSVLEYGYAVVMMHPRDFGQFAKPGNAVSATQMQELDYIIAKIQESGYDILPLGKIITKSNIIS